MTTPQSALRTLLGMKEPGKPGRIIVWDTGEISVGRSSENDIVLEDSDASRKHALFVRSAQGFGVQDLGTSNGTRVNDTPIQEPAQLKNKDAVKIGEVQITFIQTRKDPSSLGLEVGFASQLKGFGAAPADPGATTLGLSPNVGGAFDVGAVGDFHDDPLAVPDAPSPAPTRDLDLEFNDFVPGESPGPSAAGEGTLSLTFEVEGLTPELRQSLAGFVGKVVELPQLRIRIRDA